MSENVAQWLAEVRSLQQQVSRLQQEREQAYASADNWRKLYEGEAQQRRRDATANRLKMEQLQQTLSELNPSERREQTPLASDATAEIATAEIEAIERTQSVSALQTQLIAAKKQCAQLKNLLEAEQNQHEQTRESLTAALGDAVDLLAKERAAMQQ